MKRRRVLTASVVATSLLGGAAIALGCDMPEYQRSPQWRDGKFRNLQPMWTDVRAALLRTFSGAPNATPDTPLPIVHNDAAHYATPPKTGLRVTWFGHSSSLIEIDGTTVLTDPVWSNRPSPVPFAGPKRWFAPPTAFDQLPHIDAVVISHDHYDHLDRKTIAAMKSWTKTTFIVPLGVSKHLVRFGIDARRIVELDWWQSTHVRDLEIVATPARHASGRLSPQSDKTLWAGYALIGAQHRVWYSGDTGLLDAFADIGARLGPFDVTLIESGQYDATWPDWHLGPEQAVTAHRMVRGKVMIPVHWALFKLANHGWTEPAERVLAEAQKDGVNVLIPRPGQSVEPTRDKVAQWWPSTTWQSAQEHPIVATQNGDANERMKQ